jgi:hypothetical protein
MMIPEYIRFYGGTPIDVLNEYAITFFAMLNSMYTIQAKEQLNAVFAVNAGMSGKDGQSYIDGLQKQKRGIGAIVEEVRTIENIRKK